MPVYNAHRFVEEAIRSVLRQTYDNFEFIIVDDGSTDNTAELIHAFDDERIRFIKNTHNYIHSLNTGVTQATGKYIARMDADDVMHPDRLRIQCAVMEQDEKITVCSSWVEILGKEAPAQLLRGCAGLMEDVLPRLLVANEIAHPTVMLRKEFLDKHQLKYEDYPYAEDYKLWAEIAKVGGEFYVEPQALLQYRMYEEQVSQAKRKEQQATSERIRHEILQYIVEKNKQNYPALSELYTGMLALQQSNLATDEDIFEIFTKLLAKNKYLLSL